MSNASMFNEWIIHTFNSQRQKWEFLFEILFANTTLRIDKALSFRFMPVQWAPNNTSPEVTLENDLSGLHMSIEWVYVIDLDNDKFLVKKGLREFEFQYYDIPQNWIDYFL